MIRSAITVSLVPEARGGPFVFWDDLPRSCAKAAELGFDAIELFPPDSKAIEETELRRLLDSHGLKLAAVGTGAGWVRHKLLLTSPDPAIRAKAVDFVAGIIDLAGAFGAPAIIGSMQGRWGGDMGEVEAKKRLGESLTQLGERARSFSVPLIYEPLNRYETNMANTLAAGIELLSLIGSSNVTLLADLFHMSIEEASISAAIRVAGSSIGHVHFADSNRRPVGLGHTDFAPIAQALRETGYNGYASAEVFPYPDSDAAARQTIESFRKWFPAARN